MTWLLAHISHIALWIQILVGLYTVYIGVQIQRRKNIDSKVKLKPAEIGIGLALLIVGCFLLGVRAVHIWA